MSEAIYQAIQKCISGALDNFSNERSRISKEFADNLLPDRRDYAGIALSTLVGVGRNVARGATRGASAGQGGGLRGAVVGGLIGASAGVLYSVGGNVLIGAYDSFKADRRNLNNTVSAIQNCYKAQGQGAPFRGQIMNRHFGGGI